MLEAWPTSARQYKADVLKSGSSMSLGLSFALPQHLNSLV